MAAHRFPPTWAAELTTEATARGYKELTMADHSRCYENPLYMLGPCRHHRLAVAARVQLPATLSADGTAADIYETARAAIAAVLCAARQMPRR